TLFGIGPPLRWAFSLVGMGSSRFLRSRNSRLLESLDLVLEPDDGASVRVQLCALREFSVSNLGVQRRLRPAGSAKHGGQSHYLPNHRSVLQRDRNQPDTVYGGHYDQRFTEITVSNLKANLGLLTVSCAGLFPAKCVADPRWCHRPSSPAFQPLHWLPNVAR